jgi:hypothetical protein
MSAAIRFAGFVPPYRILSASSASGSNRVVEGTVAALRSPSGGHDVCLVGPAVCAPFYAVAIGSRRLFRERVSALRFLRRHTLGIRVVDELPVQTPINFDLVINPKSTKALGLDVPSSIRLRADEVIE